MPTQTGSYDFIAAAKVHEKLEEAVNPISSKTYTGLIGSANNAAEASFYFAKIHPTDYTTEWFVRFKVYVTVPANYSQTIDIRFGGYGSSFSSYDSYTARNTGLGIYYINLYRATQAGISTNHKGHAVGIGLRSASNPTDSNYARTVQVDLLETVNCTVDMFDTAVKYANIDGTGTTNYSNLTEMSVATNGQNATNNTNTHYTQFSNAVVAGTFGVKRYTLLMKQSDNTWSSFVNQANSVATTKTVSTAGYILGKLIYSAGGAEYASGANTSTVYDAYPFDFRYSSNCGSTLTSNRPVYLVGTVDENGLFYFDTTNWYTQTIPTTEDGKTYIYVGNSYSAYQVWLATENTAYRFYNGEFRTVEEVQSIIQTETLNDRIDTEIENINSNITGALTSLDASLDQEEILNRLTNYSDQEGLFVDNGKVYIRASYIKSDALTLGGEDNQYGTFVMKDENDNNIAVWDKSGLRTDWFNFQSDSQSAYIGRGDSSGIRNVYIDNDSIDIRDGQTVLASFGEETTIGRAFGETGNPLAHLDMSGDRMSFKVGNDEVAYISVDEDTLESLFYMTKAIVVQDLYFGNWQWRSRSNGNLSLKWTGAAST